MQMYVEDYKWGMIQLVEKHLNGQKAHNTYLHYLLFFFSNFFQLKGNEQKAKKIGMRQ